MPSALVATTLPEPVKLLGKMLPVTSLPKPTESPYSMEAPTVTLSPLLAVAIGVLESTVDRSILLLPFKTCWTVTGLPE